MNARFILALALAGLSWAPAAAQTTPESDPRIDDETGRLLATWPKDRLFDHIHMRLELTFPDMGKPYLEGVETLTIAPVGAGRSRITLDCNGPSVTQALLNGDPCRFEQQGKKLVVTFPRELPRGAAADLTLQYTVDFGKNKGEGLTYSRARKDGKGLTEQSPQIHAQGEAELNSRWFPCLDHPSEKLTTELVVDVEDGYEVVSNGRLVSQEAGLPGRTKWHWRQDQSHTAYLVTLVVGRLARVDLIEADGSSPRVPMPVFTPIGTEDNIRRTFAGVPEMMRFFEERFGVPYPWDKYAQCNVRDFAAGGMENTSCTLLNARMVTMDAPEGTFDDLLSHELAHQWFGDLITCKSWDHLWIQEGWATYSEALWNAHKGSKDGEEKARAAYHKTILSLARSQQRRNRGHAPVAPAVVSNRYKNPDSVFMKSDDPYSKGAMVLHMLRQRLGDKAFFEGTTLFLRRFAYKSVETDDYRRVLEEVSGQSLERFFDQWTRRPGLPRLSVTQAWDEASGMLTLNVEQTQKIDRHNPAYAITVPVLIKLTDTDSRWLHIDMDARTASGSIKLPGKPVDLSVDPNLTVLAAVKVEKPEAMWRHEAEHGPTLAARCRAVDHLRAVDSPGAQELLARIASDANADELLKQAAADALAARD
ncbi:MAG TPA: M1 family aminopeptidase [Phycisphaerales bacterium]|nr:M1 family aminopeptidase [Phycisphaerales bacterium]